MTTPAAPRRAQGTAAAGRGVRLVQVGASRARSTSPRRPATAGGSSSSSRPGGSWSCAAARPWPRRSSTSAAQVTAGGEQGLLSTGLRARLRAVGSLLRLLHRARAAPRRSGSTAAPAPTAPIPVSARLVLRMDDPEPNHNGGLMIFGPDGLHVRRHRRRRRRQRPARRARQRAVAELAAGQDPAHRPAGVRRTAVLDPVVQPVRRALGRPRRDLRLRPAQPVALLVRPRQRQPRHRRRRPGRGRGDRLRQEGRRARRELRLAPVGGPAAQLRRARAGRGRSPSSRTAHDAGFCSITGGYVVRDRGGARAVRPLRLRRLLQLGICASPRLHAGRAVDAARCRCPRSPASPRSARTPPGAST